MPKMECFGGEKDGHQVEMGADDRPDVYYAVPNLDDDKIKKVKGNRAKLELRDRLATLAYEFDRDASTPKRFVMRRNQELDKVRHQS